jgi:hypothetical protein
VPIRFYVDADLIGLGKLLVQVRPDVTYAGDPGGAGIDKRLRPPSPVQPGVYDHVWIPRIAQEGWVVITKDRHMEVRPAERDLIVANGSRHVRIQGPPAKEKRKLRKWDQLEILVRQWDAIERLLDKPGPWIYSATRTRLRQEL